MSGNTYNIEICKIKHTSTREVRSQDFPFLFDLVDSVSLSTCPKHYTLKKRDNGTLCHQKAQGLHLATSLSRNVHGVPYLPWQPTMIILTSLVWFNPNHPT